jgi:hypothetical protein
LLFEGKVGVEIDLGGFDGLVPKPKCNHRPDYTGLQQLHSGGVGKYVRCYAFGFQYASLFQARLNGFARGL